MTFTFRVVSYTSRSSLEHTCVDLWHKTDNCVGFISLTKLNKPVGENGYTEQPCGRMTYRLSSLIRNISELIYMFLKSGNDSEHVGVTFETI